MEKKEKIGKSIKEKKGKPIKEIVFSSRNKAVILHSKMYGIKKTNEILEVTFSNDLLVSKLLDAEKHGFKILYGSEDIEWIALIKEIYKPELDTVKCEEKYWNVVRENLLELYDVEKTDAIIEHYHPLILEDGSELLWNWITDLVSDDSPDAKKLAVYIEFCPTDIKKYSNIEKRVDNKIIKYPIKWEEVASVFIDSHIQVFGKF